MKRDQKGGQTITKEQTKISDFDALKIAVASPDEILEWSYGEVLKPETINYRTQKPERDGLFDERIFGPTKDFECYCGKYKKIRYKGVVCDKCGVEVTRSSVRRERMGHIDLAVPVTHIWYVHGIPSILGLILDLSTTELEQVIYFAGFIVLEVDDNIRKSALEQLEKEFSDMKAKLADTPANNMEQAKVETLYRATKQEIISLAPKMILSESKYQDLSLRYGQVVKVGIGAEAIYEILKKTNLDELHSQLNEELKRADGANRRKIMRRLKFITDMKDAGLKPEWLVMTRLPVLPPDLRPMVQLDGGRYAASDLNDLYRRVLNRNNRLKRLIAQGAPEVICRNEKRMLQEAVDSLIDNSARRGRAVSTGAAARKLRSLSDMLRGKQGRFRQNLLGKRVDYSGRSVIVIGPDLKLHQCGLPKVMALELFKPFVISKLINEGEVHNVKNATRLIERGEPIVWDILEKITSNYYVLLNRAPTLHRLGIQGFQPVLIEGKAIQIHPLVCYAFNADFDGDQMAVHVPLSVQAKEETTSIMKSSVNILKPASGEPVVSPRLDIVFGCYYLTTFQEQALGEDKIFASKNEAILAYQQGFVHTRAKIKVKMRQERGESKDNAKQPEQIVETSVGIILFNNILPDEIPFQNEHMDSKALKKLIASIFDQFGTQMTAEVVDKIKKIGFEYAGLSGMTISVADINIPTSKARVLKEGDAELEKIENQYQRGLITDVERSVKTIELWNGIRSKLEGQMLKEFDQNNPVFLMIVSGARGSVAQLTQMGGMKGLVVNPAGEIIELPIRANYKEGLSVIEYFISTHGARKGKSDTSLRTSDAGYLTRRLVDVAHDVVITTKDCGALQGLEINRQESEEMGEKFTTRIIGRISLQDIKNIVKYGEEISEEKADLIEKSNIDTIQVRDILNCIAERGACQTCYGRDLATGKIVEISTVVGIMAAQAIGEPGTQLTMKTFHLGGITGEDITSGLPRVEELFEARSPRNPGILAEIDGRVKIYEQKDQKNIVLESFDVQKEEYDLAGGYKAVVKDGDIVKTRQAIAVAPEKKAIRAGFTGKVKISDKKIIIISTQKATITYPVSSRANLKVEDGDEAKRGQELTEGHLDLDMSLKLRGKLSTQKYIIRSIQEIYASQGQTINDKHIEIIVREMFSKVKVKDNGDSEYIIGQIVDAQEVEKANKSLKEKGKKEAIVEEQVMGITRVALKTESFLSAASFQETTSVLINAATRGAIDRLQGLKENVIIGKLIPAGTALGRK